MALLAEQPEVVSFAVGTKVVSCECEWSRPVWYPGSAKEDRQAGGEIVSGLEADAGDLARPEDEPLEGAAASVGQPLPGE